MQPHAWQRSDGRDYIVVSADAHASPADFELYLSYVDPSDRDAVAPAGELSSTAISMFGGVDQGEIDDADPVRRPRRDGWPAWASTSTRRADGSSSTAPTGSSPTTATAAGLEVLEQQGIHAEVTYPGPVLAGGRAVRDVRRRQPQGRPRARVAVAARLQPVAGRLLRGRARTTRRLPSRSTSTTWTAPSTRSSGPASEGLFGGVVLPAMSTTSGLRGYSRRLLRAVLGGVRGRTGWSSTSTPGRRACPPTPASSTTCDHGGLLGLYEVFVFTRRPLWFMIFGGVFDRHPDLKVVVTENGVQWLPSLVRDMESFFDTHGGAPLRAALKMRPREYFERHVFLGGSLMRRDEAEMRDEIGVDRLMWGADYPHLEGAAPVHREDMRHVFGGMPEADLRRILGPTRSTCGASTSRCSTRSPTASGRRSTTSRPGRPRRDPADVQLEPGPPGAAGVGRSLIAARVQSRPGSSIEPGSASGAGDWGEPGRATSKAKRRPVDS